jgi:polysaccharide biosynthesis protein PslH
MRLLFVTCHLPYPPHSGGRLREHELLARLTQRFDVHIAAVTKTLAEDEEAAADIPWDHNGISLFPAAALDSLPGVAPQVARHRSEAATAGIRGLLARGRFDLVHVEGFYLWQHLPRTRPAAVLVEQNIEWQLFEQQGLREEAAVTRRAELAAWRAADALGALTAEDRAVMRRASASIPHLIPDGADHLGGDATERIARSGQRLVMVGNFGYAPNVDGALWLAREVMPRVREVVPGAELQLVGTSPPPEIQALAGDGIEVTGRVPDVGPYLRAADVVVCPLRFGGGVKVKMLEALSCGKAIVATSVGCQGLGKARWAVRVAERAEDFANAAARLLRDPLERTRAEQAAAAVELPSWDDAAEALAECWQVAARRSLAAA